MVASMYVSCSASGKYQWTAQVLSAALRVTYSAEVTLSLKLVLKVIFPTQKLRNIFCLPVVFRVLCAGRFQVRGTDIWKDKSPVLKKLIVFSQSNKHGSRHLGKDSPLLDHKTGESQDRICPAHYYAPRKCVWGRRGWFPVIQYSSYLTEACWDPGTGIWLSAH